MTLRLRYGAAAELAIDWPETTDVIDWSGTCPPPLADPTAAVRRALAAPLGHPPLAESLVAGDRVTIALDPQLPQAAALAAGIVAEVVESGHSPDSVTILWQATGEDDPGPAEGLPAELRESVHFVRHDPDDPLQQAYLAANEAGEPIYLNRALCDADFVIPVGLARTAESLGFAGLFAGLYPTFSQREAQLRLRIKVGLAAESRRLRRVEAAEEAGWLLGAQFAVLAIPAGGDALADVRAGHVALLRNEVAGLCDATWHHPAARSADLVVAALAGGPRQQTWDNVARALWMALRAVNEGGSIALATQLAARPGSALRRFGRWTEDDPVPKAKKNVFEPDLLAAQLLLAARQKGRVYLLSELSERTVEGIGAIHLDDPEDIVRLGRRQASCLVLGDAQFATLTLDSLEPSS